eukprot:TRINITY_DN9405_c0_g1_i1.p1 TRINITY_DN9405_c0_g1~~TRINITY_DN9405_c0_g1_i1.p1  ORF type:complete len:137 (-),score=20.74 TRINITY_DN9405_c0_g1_i1:103-513(-)
MESGKVKLFNEGSLVAHYGDDVAFQGEMVDMFFQNTFSSPESPLTKLFESFQARNAEETKRFAHTLKSAAKFVGLDLVGHYSELAMVAADTANFEEVRKNLVSILEVLQPSVEALLPHAAKVTTCKPNIESLGACL